MKALFIWLLVKFGEQSIRTEERRIPRPAPPRPREFDNVMPPPHKNPLIVRALNLFWEFWLGISTRGKMDANFPDAYHYETMGYLATNRILRFLELQPSDVFVDIGSGKGRVLCCASRFRVRKVEGIEFSTELHAAAEKNIVRMRGRKSPIRSYNMGAEDFDYSEGTVFMLFNPFGEATLRRVIRKIGWSLKTNPRAIRIAYANPIHDNVFGEIKWLERYEYWDKQIRGTEQSVSFYRFRP